MIIIKIDININISVNFVNFCMNHTECNELMIIIVVIIIIIIIILVKITRRTLTLLQ